MYLSKTKKSKCGYCSKAKEIHGKAKLAKDQKTLTFGATQETPPPPLPLTPMDALPIISK